VHEVIAGYVHTTLHLLLIPVRTFCVHATPSSHIAGQFRSHVSGGSTTPLPHDAGQLASFTALQPAGQHPSPSTHALIAGYEQATLH
jgi:hypothetical protein